MGTVPTSFCRSSRTGSGGPAAPLPVLRQAKAATPPAPSPAKQALQEADRRLRPTSRFQVPIFISPVLATWPATKVNVPLDRLISVEFDFLFGS
jgi:hypothetical protein